MTPMSELRVWAGEPVVLDSSVAFKWFARHEDDAEDAVDLLLEHRAGATTLVAPALLSIEIANALSCSGVGAAGVRRAMQALADADLLIAPLDASLIGAAADIAEADGLTIYDALFVALAARLEATLVTADRRQAATEKCSVRLLGGG